MKHFNENMSCDEAILRYADLLRNKSGDDIKEVEEEFKSIIRILREKYYAKYGDRLA